MEAQELRKCPGCWAHYSGDHSCPPWLEALVTRNNSVNENTTTTSEGKTLSLDNIKDAIDSLPKIPFYIIEGHVRGDEEMQTIRNRVKEFFDRRERTFVTSLFGFKIVTDRTVAPGDMHIHCSNGEVYVVKINDYL